MTDMRQSGHGGAFCLGASPSLFSSKCLSRGETHEGDIQRLQINCGEKAQE